MLRFLDNKLFGRWAIHFDLLKFAVEIDPASFPRFLYLRLTGLRVRANNALVDLASRHPNYHNAWMQIYKKREGFRDATARKVVVLIDTRGDIDDALYAATKDSAASALGHGHVCVAYDEIAEHDLEWFGAIAKEYPEAWLLPVRAGDRLVAGLGRLLDAAPDAEIYFGDEDRIDSDGRCFDPWFKPTWNRLQYYYQDFVGGACMISVERLLRCGAPGTLTELLGSWLAHCLLGVDATEPAKLPGFVVHRVTPFDAQAEAVRHASVIHRLLPSGASAQPAKHGLVDINWTLPNPPPSVTIIVPTRDRADLLKTCCDGIDHIEYPGEVERIIVDNQSVEDQTFRLFDRLRTRGFHVLPFTEPYNFPAINAAAVDQSNGDYLCLLNNDVEMPNGDWLQRMIGLAARAGTGAVGIRLHYPNGSLQHAGVVIGIGGAAGHILRGQDPQAAAHRALAFVTRESTVVTAACMVVSRAAWRAVGGMDSDELPVAFNDVDFCLKLERAGYVNVYLGDRGLIHHESLTRGSDIAPDQVERFSKEIARLQSRWKTKSAKDRYYHPFLTRQSEQYFAEFDFVG